MCGQWDHRCWCPLVATSAYLCQPYILQGHHVHMPHVKQLTVLASAALPGSKGFSPFSHPLVVSDSCSVGPASRIMLALEALSAFAQLGRLICKDAVAGEDSKRRPPYATAHP